jgi:hypothetical protein
VYGLNTKIVWTSITVSDLLPHLLLCNYPLLFILFFLIHFSDLCNLFLQHCYLLLTPLHLLVHILTFKQLFMQPIDFLPQLIILTFKLTDHSLRHCHLRLHCCLLLYYRCVLRLYGRFLYRN